MMAMEFNRKGASGQKERILYFVCLNASCMLPACGVLLMIATLDLALEEDSQQAKNQSAIALLRRWRAEAATFSEEEKQHAAADWQETMRSLDANRSSDRKLFPDLTK